MKTEAQIFKPKGISRDMSSSAQSSDYAYDIHNMRVVVNENSTQLSLETERGTTLTYDFADPIIGRCVIGNYVVIFTKGSTDKIILIDFSNDSADISTLYDSKEAEDLNFNVKNPIETIGVYENEKTIKVYWVDGINQPRAINILDSTISTYNKFDFLPELRLTESASVNRIDNSSGMFRAGVIQYCFTYSNKSMQESSIAWQSELLHVANNERALSPEEYSNASYKITIDNADTRFDYVNIYSIQRTSFGGEFTVRSVARIPVSNHIEYVDRGIQGADVDPLELLYKGGDRMVAYTMCQKDNVLFLGGIKKFSSIVSDDIKRIITQGCAITESGRNIDSKDVTQDGMFYEYEHPASKTNSFRYLRHDNWYRIGVQLQDKWGKWSEPIFIRDVKPSLTPSIDASGRIRIPSISISISSAARNAISSLGFKKMRPLCVYPDRLQRCTIAQGVVNPTVFMTDLRTSNRPFAMSSWFFRPFMTHETDDYQQSAEWRNLHMLGASNKRNGEMQHMSPLASGEYAVAGSTMLAKDNYFYVDSSICTINSPDLEDVTDNNLHDAHFRIKGCILIDAVSGSYTMTASAGNNIDAIFSQRPQVMKDRGVYKTTGEDSTRNLLLSAALWQDYDVKDNNTQRQYWVNPFHSDGCLNDNIPGSLIDPDDKEKKEFDDNAHINSKTIANLRVSHKFKFFDSPWTPEDNGYPGITDIVMSDGTPGVNTRMQLQGHRRSEYVHMTDNFMMYSGGFDYAIISNVNKYHSASYSDLDNTAEGFSTEQNKTVRLRYRSSRHAVFGFKYRNGYQVTLPLPNNHNSNKSVYPGHPYWLNYDGHDGEYTGVGSIRDPFSLVDIEEQYNATPSTMSQTQLAEAYKYFAYTEEADNVTFIAHHNLSDRGYEYVTLYLVKEEDGVYSLVQCAPGKYGMFLDSQFNYLAGSARYSQYGYTYASFSSQFSIDTIGLKVNTEEQQNLNNYLNRVFDAGIPDDEHSKELLWIGEIYRDFSSGDDVFGDHTNEYAIQQLSWHPCGGAVPISDDMIVSDGDTVFDRWDCLKTMPVASDDKNGVTEILSFMCESYRDIEGRYDRNRGLVDNTFITDVNFNMLNNAYENEDDYFVFRNVPNSELEDFSTSVVWSLPKTNGEQTDSWMSITSAAMIEMNGDLGRVNALRMFNNNIYCFQDRGISNILYNESVQISSTEGLPIEIANSGKVSGKRYITTEIGCNNKWSIDVSPSAIYFADNRTKDIYAIGSSLANLTRSKGMHVWSNENVKLDAWSENANNIFTQYNPITQDVMFTTNDDCLIYNENMGEFIGTFSYGGSSMLASVNNGMSFVFKDGMMYMLHGGDYCSFFDKYEKYWLRVIANDNMSSDKIFTNLEYHADSFDGNRIIDDTFDYLRVTDEYQEAETSLMDIKNTPSNIRKRFRSYRIQIPRDKYNGVDRIRNTWADILLRKDEPIGERTILHDLIVYYLM